MVPGSIGDSGAALLLVSFASISATISRASATPFTTRLSMEIAMWQRDELVAGARILDRARRDPAAVDYLTLQRDPAVDRVSSTMRP